MSKQLTVRLPDKLVDFIDQRVVQGLATSRAAVIAAAVERERRREVAERDAKILAQVGNDDDFDVLAAFAASTRLDDLG
jgi:Arc/MetJ-type ribon-helix-helix transcriptional regulator